MMEPTTLTAKEQAAQMIEVVDRYFRSLDVKPSHFHIDMGQFSEDTHFIALGMGGRKLEQLYRHGSRAKGGSMAHMRDVSAELERQCAARGLVRGGVDG
jgi:hypothetical protein